MCRRIHQITNHCFSELQGLSVHWVQATLARKGMLQICKVLCALVNVVIKTNTAVVGADVKMLASFTETILIQGEISL